MPITGAERRRADRLPTLETDRLILRPAAPEDVPDIAALANDEGVATRTESMPYPYHPDDARSWLERIERDQTEQAFAIVRKPDGVFAGMIGLLIDGSDCAEVGFWLGRPYWGHGYATEALARVLAYAFEARDFAMIKAGAFPDNAASIRVQEKAGMRLAGREIRFAPARGGDRAVAIREIRRRDWRK